MRKIFSSAAAGLMLSAAMVMPTFAQSSSSSSVSASATVATSAQLECMRVAVDAREGALINARTAFNTSILSALQKRRAALNAAFSVAVNSDREVKVKAAWDAYVADMKAARTKLAADVKASWTAFATATINCPVRFEKKVKDDDRKMEDKNDEDDKEKQDNGRHLGWFKTKTGANVKFGNRK